MDKKEALNLLVEPIDKMLEHIVKSIRTYIPEKYVTKEELDALILERAKYKFELQP